MPDESRNVTSLRSTRTRDAPSTSELTRLSRRSSAVERSNCPASETITNPSSRRVTLAEKSSCLTQLSLCMATATTLKVARRSRRGATGVEVRRQRSRWRLQQ